jgi:(E)-4-hydroxy-3-methylbut-2-enyl-diphosphate synthase
MLFTRRWSKQIRVGNVLIGGDAPVSVQSMTKTDTRDVAATVEQVHRLEEASCEIIRCAVPDTAAAEALAGIVEQVHIPVIADIHFHHHLALKALESGVQGLRLNPGNIRDAEKVRQVVKVAKERDVPIRIGVNFGSLPPIGGIGKTGDFHRLADGVNKLAKASQNGEGEYGVVDHMVNTALWEVAILEEMDFDQIKISVKGFDVPMTIEAYRRLAERVPYPLHLGITEAGTPLNGAIRSAVGLGTLLAMGIGDTIRVSLAGDPVLEVEAGYEILKSLNLRQKGVTLVACPSCGRADVDIVKYAQMVDEALKKVNKPVKVAVMGCEVNGPGEAKDADVGIAAGAGRGIIFRKGQKARVVPESEFLSALLEELEKVEVPSV